MTMFGRVFRERQRVVLPLLGFLIANIAVVVFWVWPLQREVDGAEESRQQALMALVAARGEEAGARNQHTSRERAEAELKKFYSDVLPLDFRNATRVTTFWLKSIADSNRVKFRSGSWEPKPVRDSQLVVVTGEVTLIGDYADIRRFLYEVETAQEFVIIQEVALSQPNVAQGSGPLELRLAVSTYFHSGTELIVPARSGR
jgi:hypothetical protein